jgi:hypothetical protein
MHTAEVSTMGSGTRSFQQNRAHQQAVEGLTKAGSEHKIRPRWAAGEEQGGSQSYGQVCEPVGAMSKRGGRSSHAHRLYFGDKYLREEGRIAHK